MEMQVKKILSEQFGYSEFRQGQEAAVSAVLAQRDALVVMPTGAGKSLCYQLPALALPGLTIVVSPLIALMQDQVSVLVARNIPATFINSTLSTNESVARLAAARSGEIKLLYVAPERFYDQAFMRGLQEVTVSLFAVDEAHCISEWGHDFRPSYLRLKDVLQTLHRPPVLALTATATPDVRRDIIASLDLKDPAVIVTGFDRPNVTYGAIRATPTEKIEHAVRLVREISGPAIIYAGTRDAVDTMREVLAVNDISVTAYHAGIDKADREVSQQQFMEGKTRVMVATNAFGLGIDKPDVRLIVHMDLPGTLEAYYQEAGRAGRDGKPSYAVLLHHPSDRYLREFFLEGENPSPAFIRAVYGSLVRQIGDVIKTTYAEILAATGMKAPEMAVSTALKALEHAGYIERPRESASAAGVQLLQPLAEVDAAINRRARVQRAVWEALRDRYGKALEVGVRFSPEEIVRSADFSREGLSRSLKALTERGLLAYAPPYRGQEIKILNRVMPEALALRWELLREKRRHDEQKLNLMEGYAHAVACRRAFILRYLGDTVANERCFGCDNCGAR
ncbi:MAG: RecQ family ATP-dependent DNA helicase [Patescibacteria group bacterium]